MHRNPGDYETDRAVALFLDRLRMGDYTPAMRDVANKAIDEILAYLDRMDGK